MFQEAEVAAVELDVGQERLGIALGAVPHGGQAIEVLIRHHRQARLLDLVPDHLLLAIGRLTGGKQPQTGAEVQQALLVLTQTVPRGGQDGGVGRALPPLHPLGGQLAEDLDGHGELCQSWRHHDCDRNRSGLPTQTAIPRQRARHRVESLVRPPDDQIDVAAGAGPGRVADTNPRRGRPISVGNGHLGPRGGRRMRSSSVPENWFWAIPWNVRATVTSGGGGGTTPERRTRQRSRPSCARSVESARAETAPAAAAAAVRGGEIKRTGQKGARLRHHDVVEQALAVLKTCAWTI